jgi:hypothetical protein
MKPADFIMAMLSFSLGLAVNQKILGTELSQKSTRALIQSLFDDLISAVCSAFPLLADGVIWL